jgi:RNA polymerase sigma factor (sigma-70 family)
MNLAQASRKVSFTEASSLAFVNSFIKANKKKPIHEEYKDITAYKYLHDVYTQLNVEREKIEDAILKLELEKDSYSQADYEALLLDYNLDIDSIDTTLNSDLFKTKMNRYRNKLIEGNLKLVIKVAMYYQNKGLPLDDLIQEGVLGFIRAIEKYDPYQGIKLGTYATWWIRQKMTRALSNKARLVRLPVHITVDITKVIGFIRRNNIVLNDSSMDLISKSLKIPDSKLKDIVQQIYSTHAYNKHSARATRQGENVELNFDTDGGTDYLWNSIGESNEDDTYTIEDHVLHNMDTDFLLQFFNLLFEKLSPQDVDILSYFLGLGSYERHSYKATTDFINKHSYSYKDSRVAIEEIGIKLLLAGLSR